MKTILVSLATLFFISKASDEFTGRWETQPSVNGNVTGVIFKEDKSFEAYVNKKPFVSGTYSYSSGDSIIIIEDNGCEGIQGIYKVIFFGNGDSMRFVTVEDDCAGRREGMEKTVLGRVKYFVNYNQIK